MDLDVSDYYSSILIEGQIKVPRNYVTNILKKLYCDSRDAQVIPIDDNNAVMLLIYEK